MPNQQAEQQLRQGLKGLLRDTLLWIEQEQTALLEDSPFASGSQAEIRLFAALRGESRSISELSRYLGVSRQAVHQTVHRLVAKGLVELQTLKGNQREKHVVITALGQQARKLTAKHFQLIEAKMAKNIGRDNVELLRTLLQQHLEQEGHS